MVQQYTPEQIEHQAGMLANRVRKRHRHLKRRFERRRIDVFRLYDWDIPEIRAVVDWYAGHLVVAEYEREQTGPDWLPRMGRAVAEALDIPDDRVFLKRRHTGKGDGPRYRPLGRGGRRFEVRERDLRFWVNLSDRVDTGLFADHRETRELVRRMARDKDFLNLYAYTGSFTCAAALGGARSTVTVDRSAPYLRWARENMELNGLADPRHRFERRDVGAFLDRAVRDGRQFQLVVVDPPSFSQLRQQGTRFEVLRDHPVLLRRVLEVTAPGGTVLFSTNHQRFVPGFEGIPAKSIEEITEDTLPEDYRNRRVHRCWRIRAPGGD
ncbi:MAG: SAM-dependent methyltransferase [Deltaproteobacteria bacterium]|nr:SAM-dependent methyltransferase [Deltaproteobacteria bacterium]